jgi:phosphonate transport system substrate-binding protein
LQAEVRTNGLNLVIMDAWESLDLDIETEMEPAFVHENQGAVYREYLLFVRQGSGIQALADLRGQEIAVLNGTSNSVARAWLESLLLEKNLGSASAFFRRVETPAKPSAALLPVFFGNKPACIVDRLSYATMVEMNPQVERQLVPLAVSEPLLESITYLTRHGYASDRARRDMFLALQELHMEPDGRQILTLFKVDKLVPYKEEYRDSLRRLRARLAESQPAPGGSESAADPARTAGEKP